MVPLWLTDQHPNVDAVRLPTSLEGANHSVAPRRAFPLAAGDEKAPSSLHFRLQARDGDSLVATCDGCVTRIRFSQLRFQVSRARATSRSVAPVSVGVFNRERPVVRTVSQPLRTRLSHFLRRGCAAASFPHDFFRGSRHRQHGFRRFLLRPTKFALFFHLARRGNALANCRSFHLQQQIVSFAANGARSARYSHHSHTKQAENGCFWTFSAPRGSKKRIFVGSKVGPGHIAGGKKKPKIAQRHVQKVCNGQKTQKKWRAQAPVTRT